MAEMCKKCGAKLEDGAIFCGNCGEHIAKDDFRPNIGGGLNKQAKIAIAGITAAIAIGGVSFMFGGSSSEQPKTIEATTAQEKPTNNKKALPEAKQQEPKQVASAIQNALDSHQAIHIAITNKNYHEAYNGFTKNMHRYMGSYDNWAKGFSLTMSSRITAFKIKHASADRVEYDFDLEARDMDDARVLIQTFDGHAISIWQNGRWLVDDQTLKLKDKTHVGLRVQFHQDIKKPEFFSYSVYGL